MPSDPQPVPNPQTAPTVRAATAAWRKGWVYPGLVIAGIAIVTAVSMRLEGRRWFCECGEVRVWITDVWTSHCSQHLADPYSLTHVSHGLIFYGGLVWLRRWLGPGWRLCIALGIAAGWEILENSPIIINRYRAETMSLEYMGDSIVNALGDVAACGLGFFLARRLGLLWSLLLFAGTELLLLALMRDNLTLNVLMLIHPVPAIKAWQSVGHG